MSRELADVLVGWSPDDLGNLCSLLELEQMSKVDQIIRRIKRLYLSKTRTGVKVLTRSTNGTILSKFSKSERRSSRSEELPPVPTYDELIIGACKHLKAFDKDASIPELELFLTHAVIIAAVQRMKPRERQKLFGQQIAFSEMARQTRIGGPSLRGPATTFALLGAAQASGFGVYLASTTALGFLTHAVGITLPFAVYAGMTNTIAFLIGPVGWMGAGLWGTWKLTQPKWKKLIPALVCIMATNSRRDIEGSI